MFCQYTYLNGWSCISNTLVTTGHSPVIAELCIKKILGHLWFLPIHILILHRISSVQARKERPHMNGGSFGNWSTPKLLSLIATKCSYTSSTCTEKASFTLKKKEEYTFGSWDPMKGSRVPGDKNMGSLAKSKEPKTAETLDDKKVFV